MSKRAHSRSGKRLTKWDRAQFIAYDGEGLNVRNRHVYAMLCASTGEHIIDERGLSTRQCLEFLVDHGKRFPKAIHVAFVASYDVNMICGDLTARQIDSLWKGFRVDIGQYAIQYRHRKTFTIREKHGDNYITRFVLWDVFGFFQSSFVEAVSKYLGTTESLQRIAEYKRERSQFSSDQLQGILEYCHSECTTLVELMQRLHDYLKQAKLKIARWDGAGACAAALLQRENVRAHMSCNNVHTTPQEVLLASQVAYAGGRMEIIRYGHESPRTVYHYDINSAYPAAMRALPSLSIGKWNRVTTVKDIHPFALYRVRWKWKSAPFYPLFWRDFHGCIWYPQEGEGWYWSPEIESVVDALNANTLRGQWRILEGWEWNGQADTKPFHFIEPLFEQRKRWKKEGVGAEKVIKLAINSLYGKTAQHIGGHGEQRPRFHQLEYAGYITSKTRATLYCAAMQSPDDMIMFATDAIYSLKPLDVPCSDKLGEWSYTEHSGITVVQSGVYWTDNDDGTQAMFCRGFDKGSLNRKRIIRAWKKKQDAYRARLTRFVGMGSALQGSEQWEHWRTWREQPRLLTLHMGGTKRMDFENIAPYSKLEPTIPGIAAAQLVGQRQSWPYPLPWSMPLKFDYNLVDGVDEPIAVVEAFESES